MFQVCQKKSCRSVFASIIPNVDPGDHPKGIGFYETYRFLLKLNEQATVNA